MIIKEISTTIKNQTFTVYWNWDEDDGCLILYRLVPNDFDDDDVEPPDYWDSNNIHNWFRHIREKGLTYFMLKSISFNICAPEEEFLILL